MTDKIQRVFGKDGQLVAIIIRGNVFKYDYSIEKIDAHIKLGREVLGAFPDLRGNLNDIPQENIEIINLQNLEADATEEEILQQVNSRNSVIEPQEENTSEQTDDNEAIIAPFPKGSFTEEYEEPQQIIENGAVGPQIIDPERERIIEAGNKELEKTFETGAAYTDEARDMRAERLLEEAGITNVKTSNSAKKKLKVGAIVAAGLILLGTVIGIGKKIKNRKQDVPIKQEEVVTVNEDSLSLEELINSLEDETQRNAFMKMLDTQKAFNAAASSDSFVIPEDGDERLFINGDEALSLFVFANSEKYAAETFAKIFGNSEKFNKADLFRNYTNSLQTVGNYYKYATEPSGLENIFLDEEDKKLFKDFENSVLENNRTHSAESRKDINDKLMAMFLDHEHDGVNSLIFTLIMPAAYENGAVDQSIYDGIVEKKNPTITCNNVGMEIDEIYKKQVELNIDGTKQTKIINKLNDLVKTLSRKINITAREEKRKLVSTSNTKKKTTSTNKSNNVTIETKQVTEEEAIQAKGAEAVQQAEQKDAAGKQKSVAEVNNTTQEYSLTDAGTVAKAMGEAHDIACNTAFNTLKNGGTVNTESIVASVVSQLSSKYDISIYGDTIRNAARLGVSDGIVDYNKMMEDSKTIIDEINSRPEQTEVTITPAENNAPIENDTAVAEGDPVTVTGTVHR